ncbi:MAG: metalloprotease RseP [Pseudomonadota bacterium]|jgi:regulator of sigma E protease
MIITKALIIIIVVGVLVFVHELGHFLVAKFFGVGVLEFALGFGRVVTRFQFGETTYTIRLIPLGGFVRMAGDDPTLVHGDPNRSEKEIVEQASAGASPIEGGEEKLTPLQEAMVKDPTRWFLKKPYGPRCAIVLAGPLFNFLFAWVLASGMYYTIGLPKMIDGPVTVGGVSAGMPADTAGMKVGDRILTVNGETVNSYSQLVEIVRGSNGSPLAVKVERPGQGEAGSPAAADTIELLVRPQGNNPELDAMEGTTGDKPTYRIGIAPAANNLEYEEVDLLGAMDAGQKQVVGLSMQTLRIFGKVLTGQIAAHKVIGGPIEIVKQTSRSVDEGWLGTIFNMILLNVALGIMNLLPIPVLDGGHLVLFTLEFLRGRPLSMRSQEYAMRVGMTLLLLLMVFAIGNDLRRLIPWSLF